MLPAIAVPSVDVDTVILVTGTIYINYLVNTRWIRTKERIKGRQVPSPLAKNVHQFIIMACPMLLSIKFHSLLLIYFIDLVSVPGML